MLWLVEFFHKFPHINFRFDQVTLVFQPSSNDYLEFLAVWSLLPLLVGAALLLIVTVYWGIRCCCKSSTQNAPKRLRHIRRYSNGLFFLNLCICLFVGLSVYSNEHFDRGMIVVTENVEEILSNIELAKPHLQNINESFAANISAELGRLKDEAYRIFQLHKNETLFGKVMYYLIDVQYAIENITDRLPIISDVVEEFELESAHLDDVEWAEQERWLVSLVLCCISLAVLLLGMFGVCRLSRPMAMLFSTMGVLIFIIIFVLMAVSLSVALMISDLCNDPEGFLVTQFSSNLSQIAVKYYMKCASHQPPVAGNPLLDAEQNMTDRIHHIQSFIHLIDTALKSLEASPKLDEIVMHISVSLNDALKRLGQLVQLFTCETIHGGYAKSYDTLCNRTIIGASLMLLGFLAGGLLLFILLLMMRQTWAFYKQTSGTNGYIEVDDSDPFLPRNETSAATNADFYGSHLMNPRTRMASATASEQSEQPTRPQPSSASVGAPLWLRNSPPPAYESLHRHANATRDRENARKNHR